MKTNLKRFLLKYSLVHSLHLKISHISSRLLPHRPICIFNDLILTNLKPHVEHSNGFAAEITLETHYFHTLRLMSSRLSKSPFYKSWTQISCTTSSERTMLEVSTQIRQNHIAEYEYGQMQENNSSKISFLHGLGSNWYEIWQMSDRMYFTCLF